jgi:hypothetical protein
VIIVNPHNGSGAMAGRLRVLTVALAVAGAALAGCDLVAPDQPVPLSPPDPAPVAPPSPAVRCGPRPPGSEQPPDAWVQFDVTEQQLDVINSRLWEVLCRQGLWRKGIGFRFNHNEDGIGYLVEIHPGHSGLSARQILDRFLGRGP